MEQRNSVGTVLLDLIRSFNPALDQKLFRLPTARGVAADIVHFITRIKSLRQNHSTCSFIVSSSFLPTIVVKNRAEILAPRS